MSDSVDRGITVTEIAAMDQPIDVSPETTAAFVGRALRGPLDTPVPVTDFGEFRRRFGGIWSRSSLGPSVKQFFEHGGRKLYVVRVANNARGALLCVPASGSALVLRAIESGSTERVRAAVDYDGIGNSDSELFNLTLQRVDPSSGLVIDQEMYRKLSYRQDADTFVADVLLTSTMVRVEHPYPTHRPERTENRDGEPSSNYIDPVQDGTDGTELSDYDLVGCRRGGRGIFALEQVDDFDLLYMPPPGKGVDVGPAAILAAELYCRTRGAMLIIDPSAAWKTAEDAVAGVRQQGFASPNMIGYFPRLLHRGEPNALPRAAGGAVAGLLCKLDRTHGPWQELDAGGLGFDRSYLPAIEIGGAEAAVLAREGLNTISSGDAGKARFTGSTTMSRGSESHRRSASLPVRRLCLRIASSIEQATRWFVFEEPSERRVENIRARVFAYLMALANSGAFVDDRIVVECDTGLCKKTDGADRGLSLMISFQPTGCRKPISFTLHQSVEGCRIASTAFAPVFEDCA